MLFEHIKNIEKIAIEIGNEKLSYQDLIMKATDRSGRFIGKKVLLNKENTLENIIDFVACMQAGAKAVFVPHDLNSSLLETYKKQFDLLESKDCHETVVLKACYAPNTQDIFLGVLSSGTEGEAKLIWKDYGSWFSAFPHQSDVFNIHEKDKILILDALSYSANLNSLLHGFWCGCTVILCSLRESKNWHTIIEDKQISSIFIVSSHLKLLTEPSSSIKTLVSAGEKLPALLAKKLKDNFPKALLTEYYGTAELGHVTYIQDEDIIQNPLSVGKAFPGVKIDLKEKEIYVWSTYVSPAYRQKNTVSDLGYWDQNGFLYLLGRAGRMYNKRGVNVFALEIEMAAMSHILIQKAALTQEPISQKLVLWVETKEELKAKDVRAYLETKISKSKIPNKIKLVLDLPKLLSGKINYKELQKEPHARL